MLVLYGDAFCFSKLIVNSIFIIEELKLIVIKNINARD